MPQCYAGYHFFYSRITLYLPLINTTMYGNATMEQIRRAKECIASELKLKVKTVMPDKVYTPEEIGRNIVTQLKQTEHE